MTPPGSTDTVLVSQTTYDSAGRLYQTTDPKGIVTQTIYDAAGRTKAVVEDFGTLNRTTNTAYTVDIQVKTLTASIPTQATRRRPMPTAPRLPARTSSATKSWRR